jgi:heme exporter protein D
MLTLGTLVVLAVVVVAPLWTARAILLAILKWLARDADRPADVPPGPVSSVVFREG